MRLHCQDVMPDGWACTVYKLPSGARLQVDELGGVQRVYIVRSTEDWDAAVCVSPPQKAPWTLAQATQASHPGCAPSSAAAASS